MNMGHIRIIKVKEHKDGSATIDIEYDKIFAYMIKALYGWKRLTQKRLENVIVEALRISIKRDEKRKCSRKKNQNK